MIRRRKLYLERLIQFARDMRYAANGDPVAYRIPPMDMLWGMMNNLNEVIWELEKKGNPQSHPDYHSSLVLRDVIQGVCSGQTSAHMVGEKFGGHLAKTEVHFPSHHLVGDTKPRYIEFPENLFFKHEEGFYYTCAMVSFAKTRTGDDMLMIVLPDDFRHDTFQIRSTYYFMPLLPNKTIHECIEELEQYLGVEVPLAARQAISFVAKCMLYINSGEPDLVKETVTKPNSKNEKKIRNHWKKNYPFELIRVGYGFHGKTYSVDSTEVSGHFRWQPCGVGRQQLKLIWIDEHIRNYKRDMK